MTTHNSLSVSEMDSASTKHKLAVYGTLKRNMPNNHLMKKQKFLGSGQTSGNHTLHGLMVFKEPATAPVVIDLYEVEEKQLEGPLDSLEANGSVYKREKTNVTLEDGTEHEAWLYFGLPQWVKARFDPEKPPLPPKGTGVYNWGSYT